jgi:hypothetical protein
VSRRACSRPERSEVSPFVFRIQRHTVICLVGSVDLDRAIAGEESTERLVDESGIRQL